MNWTALLMLAAGGAGFALALLLTRAAIPAALRINFVDRPGGHKSHREPMPYGGGTAIFLSAWLLIGVVLLAAEYVPQSWIEARFGEIARAYMGGLRERLHPMLVILAGGFVLHVLGLIDDVRPLPAIPKLIVILGISVATAWYGDVRIGQFAHPAVSIALTALWISIIVNAFNFLDNMDGLSSGVAGICMIFFIVCGLLAKQVLVPALACVFFGAIGGFWVFNFPPARIFMGDAGSLVIGYMLAVVSILTTYYESGRGGPPFALAMPLVILAVPLYDFVSVMTIRLREGRNPMRGDQRHFSHRLVERGLSRRFAVLTIYLATAATGLAATLLPKADLRETLTLVVVVLFVLAIIAILESPLRREP